MEFIDLKTQYQRYQEQIDLAIKKVLLSARFIMGPEVIELEEALADYVGVKYCISASSGTDTLLMALMALDIGPGDEVITTPYTFISTSEVISLLGAKPVFVDIEESTFNMNVDLIESAMTSRTKAILPVNLFGQMPSYKRIQAIADKYQIPVIEDAAQSFGAKQDNRRSCGMSLVASTSFFPAKPFGCYGDGGALFTNDANLAKTLRSIREHGAIERNDHRRIGINGRLDTIQASVLLAKLPYYEEELLSRSKAAKFYHDHLKEFCIVPQTQIGNTHVFAQYTIRVENRDELQNFLLEKGIPAAIYYPRCLHEQEVFHHLAYKKGDFPVAEKICKEVLSLPMHPWLSEEELIKITAAVSDFLCVEV
ncbi:MAG: aminotransferase DegT [Waddliaceae bacterium]|nr:aminotransferase DegT [Waddliaceae bacterium]